MSEFIQASSTAFTEIEDRRNSRGTNLKFGIPFIDDATRGIRKHDLVLIGAESGVGKTELCCNIALENMKDGKKVHYIALEAEPFEIERRLKYQLLARAYHSAPIEIRPRLSQPLEYDSWEDGEFIDELKEFEAHVADIFDRGYKDLFLLYKQGKFGLDELIKHVTLNAQDSDLIIVDHIHYFDLDDDNENRAMKEIMSITRDLALENGRPIIMVAHLRKMDKMNQQAPLCPGKEDFHGSSDLFKIATKVIVLAPGEVTSQGNFETFVRVAKNRKKGSASRYLGRLIYSAKDNSYAQGYKIGVATLTRKSGFEELAHHLYPTWARNKD